MEWTFNVCDPLNLGHNTTPSQMIKDKKEIKLNSNVRKEDIDHPTFKRQHYCYLQSYKVHKPQEKVK